ncbi:MAG: hypothetical protein DRP52_01095 [Planctomycetota bacterium]|nr:MAG: hypothetical protein DRP52_01095 [Planctomycetota bacterium]RLC74468.1 MAG: hypothetical protein DRJ03_31895 [Chloroflexota bacterium]
MKPRIIAHMPCRNEVDIIEETITELFRWDVDRLIVIDGLSDDGTAEKLQGLACRFDRLVVISQADPDNKFSNAVRTELQRATAEYDPDWVLSVDTDEIYHTDPVAAILAADAVGANVVRSYVPQFWLTFDDLREYGPQMPVGSIQELLRWYSWGHMGTFAWKWNDAHYYPTDVSKRTPCLPGLNWRQWQIAPGHSSICKHYCIRSLEQGLKRAKERIGRGGTWQFGKYDQNWLIDEKITRLHYLSEFDHNWNRNENHRQVHRYMAGELT